MKIIPRPYQQEAVDACISFFQKGWQPGRHGLIVLPTAAGKTIVFSLLIRHCWNYGMRSALILAHRQELVEQAETKLKKVWPDAPVGVYCAGLGRKEIRPITVAARDSFISALKLKPRFDLVIPDEAHNISPDEETRYRQIFDALEKNNRNTIVVGFTATPFRTGTGRIHGYDQMFKDLVYDASIRDLIDQGYLCPLIAPSVDDESVIQTDDIRLVAGDFAKKALAERANKNEVVEAAVKEWHRLAYQQGRRCTVVFSPHLEHAHHVSELIQNWYGIEFPVVHANTPKDQRAQILADVDSGRLSGVANVGVLTEGWDCPRLDCIALMRPTMSLTLYIQMVGRGLRLHPDKENTLVLDFGQNIARFGPIDRARPPARRNSKEPPRCVECPECGVLNGRWVQICTGCQHRLRQPAEVRVCPACGCENGPHCRRCEECGYIFAKHDARAASGELISSEPPKPKWYTVSEVSCQSMVSKIGNPYLKVVYRCGYAHHFFRNLMVGFPGRLGQEAVQAWEEITVPGTPIPETPEQAAMLASRSGVLRKPHKIQVDTSGQFPEILEVTYTQQEASSNDEPSRQAVNA